jgi:hypothetical protein
MEANLMVDEQDKPLSFVVFSGATMALAQAQGAITLFI